MAVQEQYNYHHANDCQQQQHDLLLETSQRFPAAFYLLIQLGFRLHLEPSDNSHIPLGNWDFGKLGKNLPPIILLLPRYTLRRSFLYVFYPVDPSFCRNNLQTKPHQKLVSTGILPYENPLHVHTWLNSWKVSFYLFVQNPYNGKICEHALHFHWIEGHRGKWTDSTF